MHSSGQVYFTQNQVKRSFFPTQERQSIACSMTYSDLSQQKEDKIVIVINQYHYINNILTIQIE